MKPMLAAKDVDKDLDQIRYPVLCSPKLDGIRCVIVDGKPMSRTLKPIPNKHINSMLSDIELDGLDGELTVGPPNAEDVYLRTDSGVMSHGGEPDFFYHVFDQHNAGNVSFENRLRGLPLAESSVSRLRRWAHQWINSTIDLLAYEEWCLNSGYEGVIIRNPAALYKFGRSTLREQGMMKLKRFVDGEAEIIEVIELQHNDNAATLDELGHTKRSTAQAGKRAGGTMGAMMARDLGTGSIFKIGMFKGLKKEDKQQLWDTRDSLPGRIVKYSSFPIGVKDAPRHGKFLGFRNPIDFDR